MERDAHIYLLLCEQMAHEHSLSTRIPNLVIYMCVCVFVFEFVIIIAQPHAAVMKRQREDDEDEMRR